MPEFNWAKLLPFLEKDLPAVSKAAPVMERDAAGLPATITKDAEVVGQGTSQPSPSGLPIQDVDTTSPLLNDINKPSSLEDKWNMYKTGAAVGGAGALGTGLSLLANQPSQPPQASIQAHQQAKPAAPAPKASEDEDEDEEPTTSAKAAPAAPKASSGEADADTSGYTSAPNIASLAKLQQAQQQMEQARRANEGGRIGAAMAAGMSGRKNEFEPIFDERAKEISQIPGQYLQQVEFQKQDPKSAISQTYRKMASDLGLPANEGTSAAELEKAFPQIVNIKTREDMIEARKEIAKDRVSEQHFRDQQMGLAKEQMQAERQAREENRQNNVDDKRLDTWSFKMNLPSSRTTLGQAKTQLYSIDRVQALLNGHPLNDINPQEAAEVYKGLDRVISGGSPTVQGSKSLDPNTAMSGIKNLMQQVTNQSQGANAGNFLKRINGNLENEKTIARKTAIDISNQLMAGGAEMHKRKPEVVQDFLQRQGLPPDLFEQPVGKAQGYQGASSSQIGPSNAGSPAPQLGKAPAGGQDPKIAKYASDNSLQYDQAAQLLKARGYNAGQ